MIDALIAGRLHGSPKSRASETRSHSGNTRPKQHDKRRLNAICALSKGDESRCLDGWQADPEHGAGFQGME